MNDNPFMHISQDDYEQTYFPNVQISIFIHEAHIRTVPCGWSYPEHAETMFEINYIMSGEQSTRIGNRHYRLQPSDLILFRPGEAHENRCDSTEGMTYFCLHFDLDDNMFRRLLCTGRQMYFPSNDPRTKRIQSRIRQFIRKSAVQAGSPLLSRMDALSLAVKLFSSIAEYLLEENEHVPLASVRNSQLARKAAELIERYLHRLSDCQDSPPDKDIVSTIAQQLGISPSYLSRIFHQTFAVSPRQYLTSLMVNRAKLLLLNEQLSVEEVARRLGYYDLSHFSRQFKRWTGKSPSAYR